MRYKVQLFKYTNQLRILYRFIDERRVNGDKYKPYIQ